MLWEWTNGESEMIAIHILKADLKGSPADHAPEGGWTYVGPHQRNTSYGDDNHYWFKRPWGAGQRGGVCGLASKPHD